MFTLLLTMLYLTVQLLIVTVTFPLCNEKQRAVVKTNSKTKNQKGLNKGAPSAVKVNDATLRTKRGSVNERARAQREKETSEKWTKKTNDKRKDGEQRSKLFDLMDGSSKRKVRRKESDREKSRRRTSSKREKTQSERGTRKKDGSKREFKEGSTREKKEGSQREPKSNKEKRTSQRESKRETKSARTARVSSVFQKMEGEERLKDDSKKSERSNKAKKSEKDSCRKERKSKEEMSISAKVTQDSARSTSKKSTKTVKKSGGGLLDKMGPPGPSSREKPKVSEREKISNKEKDSKRSAREKINKKEEKSDKMFSSKNKEPRRGLLDAMGPPTKDVKPKVTKLSLREGVGSEKGSSRKEKDRSRRRTVTTQFDSTSSEINPNRSATVTPQKRLNGGTSPTASPSGAEKNGKAAENKSGKPADTSLKKEDKSGKKGTDNKESQKPEKSGGKSEQDGSKKNASGNKQENNSSRKKASGSQKKEVASNDSSKKNKEPESSAKSDKSKKNEKGKDGDKKGPSEENSKKPKVEPGTKAPVTEGKKMSAFEKGNPSLLGPPIPVVDSKKSKKSKKVPKTSKKRDNEKSKKRGKNRRAMAAGSDTDDVIADHQTLDDSLHDTNRQWAGLSPEKTQCGSDTNLQSQSGNQSFTGSAPTTKKRQVRLITFKDLDADVKLKPQKGPIIPVKAKKRKVKGGTTSEETTTNTDLRSSSRKAKDALEDTLCNCPSLRKDSDEEPSHKSEKVKTDELRSCKSAADRSNKSQKSGGAHMPENKTNHKPKPSAEPSKNDSPVDKHADQHKEQPRSGDGKSKPKSPTDAHLDKSADKKQKGKTPKKSSDRGVKVQKNRSAPSPLAIPLVSPLQSPHVDPTSPLSQRYPLPPAILELPSDPIHKKSPQGSDDPNKHSKSNSASADTPHKSDSKDSRVLDRIAVPKKKNMTKGFREVAKLVKSSEKDRGRKVSSRENHKSPQVSNAQTVKASNSKEARKTNEADMKSKENCHKPTRSKERMMDHSDEKRQNEAASKNPQKRATSPDRVSTMKRAGTDTVMGEVRSTDVKPRTPTKRSGTLPGREVQTAKPNKHFAAARTQESKDRMSRTKSVAQTIMGNVTKSEAEKKAGRTKNTVSTHEQSNSKERKAASGERKKKKHIVENRQRRKKTASEGKSKKRNI